MPTRAGAPLVDGDAGGATIDAIASKYLGRPYPCDNVRLAVLIGIDHQTVSAG